jgi:pyruvate/2-oxoglutarate dehydrogenase complex dihydrolipoamide dehydrogenase (E3) component
VQTLQNPCRVSSMQLTVNDTKGLIKMAVDPKKNNRIVGVHILASIAADIIHEAVKDKTANIS